MRPSVPLLAAVLAVAPAGCRRPLPTRPDQLAPGTFAATVHGHLGAPDTAATFDDRITGTACRVGTYLLLETPRRSWMLTVWVPVLPDTPATYPLRARPSMRVRFRADSVPVLEPPAPEPPGQGPAAEGHLNYAGPRSEARPRHGSMFMVDGTVAVAVLDSGDLRGTVRARLREGIEGEGAVPGTADLAGVFRVDARDVCEYARPARSGLTKR